MTEEKKIEKVNKQKNKKDKEKRRRRGINILDVLIILCILAVAVLLFFVYSPLVPVSMPSDEADIIYSVRISGVPADYATHINIGDKVSDPSGYDLGKIASAVEVEAHTMYVFDTISGGIKTVSHPDLVDLIITVTATAKESRDGYLIDGRRIAVEGEYELLLPNIEACGMCISLSEENAKEVGGEK